MNYREQIMALRPHARLEAALNLLDRLTCIDKSRMAKIRLVYGLTRSEAALVTVLSDSKTYHPLSSLQQGIHELTGASVTDRTVNVLIFRARSKGVDIAHLRGEGWMLRRPIDLRRTPQPVKASYWTQEQDDELLRMRGNRSTWHAIAEEVEKAESSCRRRFKRLTGK